MAELYACRDMGGIIQSTNGSDDHARLIEVLHKLDDEISQAIRDTPVTPIPAFDHGISRSTASKRSPELSWPLGSHPQSTGTPRTSGPDHTNHRLPG
jgi:hypothetical protein